MILVPTLCVGMQGETLQRFDTLERTAMGYHTQRGKPVIDFMIIYFYSKLSGLTKNIPL